MGKPRTWFEIKASADETGPVEIYIYDSIGKTWWDDDKVMSASRFIKELKECNGRHVNLHINSPGGSVFEGHAIANAIKRHSGGVTVFIDGLAASIASEVAIAGERIVMAGNGMLMIHKAWSIALANADEMRKTADILDKLDQSIITSYAEKTGMDRDELLALMAEETWFTADEALEAGFVDEVGVEVQAAALAQHDFAAMGFRHIPEALAALDPEIAEQIRTARDDAAAAVETLDEVLDGADDDAGDDSDDSVEPVAGDTPASVGDARLAALLRSRFEEV